MAKPEVLEKSPMNVVEVKAALERIHKEDPEASLNFRAQKAEEYAQDFARISEKKAKELFAELQKLEIPRVREQHIHKFIDLLPSNEKQVKLILGTYHLTVTGENVKKIADAIQSYLPKR